jgi:membrane protein YqaA with SNARE-associated domain
MYILVRLVIVAIFSFGLNTVPFFMPPTWAVLTYFSLKYQLPFVLLVLTGAVASTAGRIMLWHLAKTSFRKFLPSKMQSNFADLGEYLEGHEQISIPIILFYSFSPIPSNHFFIAAGLAKAKIRVIAVCFFISRIISYTIWISTAHFVIRNLESVFQMHYGHWTTFAWEIFSLFLLFLMSKIQWRKVLKMKEKTHKKEETSL